MLGKRAERTVAARVASGKVPLSLAARRARYTSHQAGKAAGRYAAGAGTAAALTRPTGGAGRALMKTSYPKRAGAARRIGMKMLPPPPIPKLPPPPLPLTPKQLSRLPSPPPVYGPQRPMYGPPSPVRANRINARRVAKGGAVVGGVGVGVALAHKHSQKRRGVTPVQGIQTGIYGM